MSSSGSNCGTLRLCWTQAHARRRPPARSSNLKRFWKKSRSSVHVGCVKLKLPARPCASLEVASVPWVG